MDRGGENKDVYQKQWQLQPESEYRFELDPGKSLAIKLVRGYAEIFGAELAEGKTYLFGQECKAAIYTWQGCTIEMSPMFFSRACVTYVTGQPSVEYLSDETPMSAYANVHVALEQMRIRALAAATGEPLPDEEGAEGPSEAPRVLVLGPENSGKTSVCKILTNYTIRGGEDWAPMYVNVDPSEVRFVDLLLVRCAQAMHGADIVFGAQGGWAVPGAVAAAAITAPLQTATAASPLGAVVTSAPNHVSSNGLLPLSYWYGHAEMKRNPLLMERLIRNLGENIRDRWEHDVPGRSAGLIVDTPSALAASSGSGSDHRLTMIKACVDAFHINVILIVGHEKLNVEMQRTYGKRITVVKIPKSGGVVELDQLYRLRVHKYQLHNYFYGHLIEPPSGLTSKGYIQAGEQTPELTMHLSPSSMVVNFADLTIYRIGEG
ncbi:mRNA cleavage and polyadenylation factor CLP1 [Trametes pubescens]|uniref:Polynucleotide 5'-hydroxyl-kinase GRC3 n=1 Tax=Trametes pubescens TaxID=154538 RepID=A0A1M2V7G7_TRAPU|nr:mRNA cleavage and polyadenylation factor CLP1 [Trametes pubescens]